MSSPYAPPLAAMTRALGVAGLDEVLSLPLFEHLQADDVGGVLEGVGRIASEVIAPTDQIGDQLGAQLDVASGRVTVPPEVKDAYRRWVADGWAGLTAPVEQGGGGLPRLVGAAAEEMFASANMALSLNPMLTQGAVHLLEHWGNAEQRSTYLPRLISGEWTGTMNLTEPDAGSDLGAIRARAVPRSDGRWALTGTKIFITWGEHDLADNIVHLVLARTPGAPPGSRGISLFVVSRNLLDDSGRPGARNSVRCTALEHKLGIHASPTCVLEFDEAVGELVGHECGGLEAMFTMMNAARLSVGLEGLAVSERAFQQALRHAGQRRQGRAPGAKSDEPSPIVDHPDVRRDLLLMRSGVDAMRLLLYATAATSDLAQHHPDADRRAAAAKRMDLLTPLAKAWSTDEGVRLSSLAVQVHGGMGYVEETGVAQRYRDARIAPIYEGTNGIQAIDLVSRKVRRDGGAAMRALTAEVAQDARALDDLEDLKREVVILDRGIDALAEATSWITGPAGDVDRLAAATPYLHLASLTVCAGLLARQVDWVRTHEPADLDAVAGRFRFFALERLAPAPALLDAITAGAERLSPHYLE